MRAAHSPRSMALVGTAIVTATVLLVWFTVIVKQAETRGQHRRSYQQQTGEIMMPLHADGRHNTGRQNRKPQPTAVAQR